MISSTALGYVAGFLTTVSFLPQVIKAWRTRSTKDLSFWMLGAFSGGVSLWIVYGLMLQEPPIVLFNGITLVLSLVLVFLKATHLRELPQRQ